MATLLKVCGGALIILVFLVYARGERHAAAISAAAGLIILTAVFARAAPIVTFVTSISEDTPYSPVIGVLLKALGVTLIAESAAGVCRDAGEGSLAEKVEFAGRVEVLLLCLPLVSAVLDLAKGML